MTEELAKARTAIENLRASVEEAAEAISILGNTPEADSVHLDALDAIWRLHYLGDKNLMHNYAYREQAMKILHAKFERDRPRGVHGVDEPGQEATEHKSALMALGKGRTLNVLENQTVGEIDKVHLRERKIDDIYKGCGLVAGIFMKESVRPVIVFHVPKESFVPMIGPKIKDAAEKYFVKTDSLKKNNGRDSLQIHLSDLASLNGFDVVSIDLAGLSRNDVRLRLPQTTIRAMAKSKSPFLAGYKVRAETSDAEWAAGISWTRRA